MSDNAEKRFETDIYIYIYIYSKANPVHFRTGPEASRRLKLPDLQTIGA